MGGQYGGKVSLCFTISDPLIAIQVWSEPVEDTNWPFGYSKYCEWNEFVLKHGETAIIKNILFLYV